MKKLFIILGFLTAIVAVILAVTPLSNLSVIPISVAFICGLIVLLISKKKKAKTKTIQYIFLLVIISLSLTIYKNVIQTTKVGNTEGLEERDKENLEDSREVLRDVEFDEDF
ncbi:hypothetical protein [Winogradskyella sp. PG-2]|uniref:hypothetical protein n=1 Tax=Winogradskyella sp. PG-2 TaxID=754409 RepID=UPI00045896DB|nr:hypothetical protein [Winogradskyella sp. PG-2]BAO76959.1 hypothetical protein WPG_2729 [Winogradskyella sp. PG-2]